MSIDFSTDLGCDPDLHPWESFATVNALGVLEALGLPPAGELDITGARRALVRAIARTPDARERGIPDRVTRFALFVEEAARQGARAIRWS